MTEESGPTSVEVPLVGVGGSVYALMESGVYEIGHRSE